MFLIITAALTSIVWRNRVAPWPSFAVDLRLAHLESWSRRRAVLISHRRYATGSLPRWNPHRHTVLVVPGFALVGSACNANSFQCPV
jgi:hypothetical protein